MSDSQRGSGLAAIDERDSEKGTHGRRAEGTSSSDDAAIPYETRLTQNPGWALSEGGRHFEEESAVFGALRKITKRLDDLDIPYAVVGGMALFLHGLHRFTEDVDILVTKENLRKVHAELGGLGYLPPHKNSKNLRDTELGVRIEFLTSGEYPGDGKEKPVSFPDPVEVSIEKEGVKYLDLPTLIELKLASGMTNPGRLKDLADVLELIKLLNLPANFSEQLNPYVRDKFAELWSQGKKRFVTVWRNKWLTADAKSIDEMIASLKDAAETLEAMRRDGVTLDDNGGVRDDYVRLVTTDPEVAKKYDMVEETEFWGEEADELENHEAETGRPEDVSEPG
jgi:hypothetical protein